MFCSWCDQMILCMKHDHVVRSVPQPCCISVQAFPRGRSKEHLKQFYYNSKFGDFSIFNTRWAHVLYNLLECKKKHVYMSLWYVPSILELERLWTGRHPFKLAQPLKSTTKAQHASRSRTMKFAKIRGSCNDSQRCKKSSRILAHCFVFWVGAWKIPEPLYH